MKIFALALFITTSAYAGKCPVLKGEYHCMFSDNTYSLLKIQQKKVSETLTEYSFDYLAYAGAPDVFNASETGEPDDMGWITRCAGDRLKTLGNYGSMLSEIYLDKQKALTRTQNGVIVQSCPKKVSP
jgi:hypothetical protein